jgi:hypothetical protein
MANLGNLTFGAPSVISLGDNPADLAFADLNGDGAAEIVVAYAAGLRVLTNTCPAEACAVVTAAPSIPSMDVRWAGASPNPFNPRVTLSFVVERETVSGLRVYDASGRLVRELLTAERLQPGPYAIVWDGRSDSGRSAASGVYWFHLTANDATVASGALVLVK